MDEPEVFKSGPQLNFKIYEGSLADFLLQKLKALPQDDIIQVDGETGKQQSVREFLKTGIAVAEGFRELGLRVGTDIVPFVANYSWNSIAAAVGGVLSGVPIFPIDPDLKALELKQLFQSCQPRLIFCEKKCAQYVLEALDLLEIVSAKVFLLDEGNSNDPRFHNFDDIVKESDVNTYSPPVITSPADTVAMIAASSGTTGLPKGVMVTHTNMLFQLQLYNEVTFVRNRQSYLQVTHIFWISGMTAILVSCLTGLRNIFIGNVTSETVLNAIEKYKPEWTLFPPVLIARLLYHPDLKEYDLSSLKFIRIGGSMLPNTIADRLKKEWPVEAAFAQGYGMTELTGGVTTPSKSNLYAVGKLRPGTQLKVVDVSIGRALGPNEIGEMRFKSSYGMMKGYLGNKEATLRAYDGSGFYCSGDVGYYTEDNHLYVIDRIKELIKCRNHQIAPSELESVILNMPGVEDVGVVGVPHEVDMYRPMALVVKRSAYQITEQDIIDYVAETLSKHKQLYGGVKFVNAIPRTPNGKIKRSLLAQLI